jgi:hypothetical protein
VSFTITGCRPIAALLAFPVIAAFFRVVTANLAFVVNTGLAKICITGGPPKGAIKACHAVAFVVNLSAATFLGSSIIACAVTAGFVRVAAAGLAGTVNAFFAVGRIAGVRLSNDDLIDCFRCSHNYLSRFSKDKLIALIENVKENYSVLFSQRS